MNEFGSLESAKAQHPEFFKPGNVTEALLDSEPWYVYCGDAEKCFDDEVESELYEEAEVQAKCHLYNHFSKDNPAVRVSAEGARRMYQFAESEFRYVVVGVPKSGVTVTVSPAPVADGPESIIPVPSAQASAAAPKISPSPPNPTLEAEVSAKRSALGVVDAHKVAENSPVDDEARLKAYRKRLAENPNDYHVRMRMARLFARQGNPRRACRNYADAVRIIANDPYSSQDEKSSAIKEVADFEAASGFGGAALKHFRLLQKIGTPECSIYATGRISRLIIELL